MSNMLSRFANWLGERFDYLTGYTDTEETRKNLDLERRDREQGIISRDRYQLDIEKNLKEWQSLSVVLLSELKRNSQEARETIGEIIRSHDNSVQTYQNIITRQESQIRALQIQLSVIAVCSIVFLALIALF